MTRRERSLDARSARSTRAASSTTSSRCPSTCATRSGGSSRLGSSRVEASGLIVCGMGGSAIGGVLAARRARRPARPRRCWSSATTRCRPGRRPTAPCSARATRATPRRRSPASRPPRRSAPQRYVATTGGALAEAARAAGVPVIGLPAGLQPRAAVGYMFTVACEIAALVGAAPGDAHRDRRAPPRTWRRAATRSIARAGEIAEQIDGAVPADLRLRPDRPGRLPLEDPDQRERQAARVRPSAARARPQRDRRLDGPNGGARASRRSSSTTPTSIRASASAPS